jgi:hypothetical protein
MAWYRDSFNNNNNNNNNNNRDLYELLLSNTQRRGRVDKDTAIKQNP